MSRRADAAAVVVAAVVLVIAAWVDTSVLTDAQQQAAATFDPSGYIVLRTLATVALAGGCLAVGWAGSRGTPVVGLVYVVVGAFFALLPWLYIGPAASVNGAPAMLPDPVVQVIDEIAIRTEGQLDAVGVIGGAMLIAGLVAFVRARGRRGATPDAAPSSHAGADEGTGVDAGAA